jgi:hypothetical protein
MPFKDKDQTKEYNKRYYENKKINKNAISPEHYITLLLHHNKRWKRILRQLLRTIDDNNFIKWHTKYKMVMEQYNDKAVNYFEHRANRTPLTVGERYITEARDDEGIAEPLFFTITSKTKHGINVSICESWQELQDNRVIYRVDYAEQVEEATISNEQLIHITPFNENLTYYSKKTFIPSNNIQSLTFLDAGEVKDEVKAEVKYEVKAEVKDEVKAEEVKAEVIPTQAKAINPEDLLKRQTHTNQLIPQLKIDTQLIQINQMPPLYWKIIAKQGDKYELEQYKTHTGRDSQGRNVFTSFYEDKTNVNVFLPLSLLYNFEIHNPNKFYSDNKPNKRVKGFTTTTTMSQLKHTPNSLLQYLY